MGSDPASSAYASMLPQTMTSSIMAGGGTGIALQLAKSIDPALAHPAAKTDLDNRSQVMTLVAAAPSSPTLCSRATSSLTSTRSSSRRGACCRSCSSRAPRSARRDVDAVVAPTRRPPGRAPAPPAARGRPRRACSSAPARGSASSPAAVTLAQLDDADGPAGRASWRASAAPSCAACSRSCQREHHVNRALMRQELAFLDHLLRLVDRRRATRPSTTAPATARPRVPLGLRRRAAATLDLRGLSR